MTGPAMPWSALLSALKPVCARDHRRWAEVKASLRVESCYWYSASALDLTPVVAAAERTAPFDGPHPLFVLNDYAMEVTKNLKTFYADPVAGLDAGGWARFLCKLWDREMRPIREIATETLLPLRFWDDAADVAKAYERRFESAYCSGGGLFQSIVDEAWHAVYFEVRHNGATVPVLFWGAESHLVFREVFARFELPIDVFISNLDQGGKSGTNAEQLADIHPRSRSDLGLAFLAAKPRLRPRIWNDCRSVFRGEEIHTPRWHWNYSRRTRFHHVQWPNIGSTGAALARACYTDDFDALRALLDQHPELDLNTPVHVWTPDGKVHIGAPLVLTGRADIARFLVERGADPTREWRGGLKVTALSSARLDLKRARRRCRAADATDADREAERQLAALVEYFEALAVVAAPASDRGAPRPSLASDRPAC